jgi:hypothetical protein
MTLIFRIGAVSIALLHLSKVFLPFIPAWLLSLASIVLLVSGLAFMNPGFKKATAVFIIAGFGLLACTRQPAEAWISACNSMTNMVAIMVAMQAVSIPVFMGHYDASIRDWAGSRFATESSLFIFSTMITHLLASILMLGAIPLSMNLLGSTIKSRTDRYDRFLSAAASRGYVLSHLWAPGAINLYLVVQATGVSWSSMFVPGMILALLGLALSYWMESRPGGVLRAGRKEAGRTSEAVESAAIRHVVIVAVAIVAIVLALERLSIGAGYTRIMLAGLLVAALWTALLSKAGTLKAAARNYWADGLLKVRDMGPFFVAMGIFSGALESSGLVERATPVIRAASVWLGIAGVAVLPLTIIALSLVGLHPFITIVLFGTILSKVDLPLPRLTIALSLAAGGAASYMISPFAGIIMSIARYTGAKASDIALRWNWKFSLAFFCLGVCFAFAWGAVFG